MFSSGVALAVAAIVAVQATDFQIENKEDIILWIGIQGNDGKPPLRNGGFILGGRQTVTVVAPDDWAGRFWARTWCDNKTYHCLTGDCGNKLECGGSGGAPPITLIEITLKGSGGLDYYDISLVDGFNRAASISPVGGSGSCKEAACNVHINRVCPEELRLNSIHGVLGCYSACSRFNTDEYCCRNSHNKPDTCKPNDWPNDYAKFFKTQCPDAYSYAYDDRSSTFTCRASKYIITFGIDD